MAMHLNKSAPGREAPVDPGPRRACSGEWRPRGGGWPCPGGWWGGPQVREDLNHFMLDRNGRLFCDGPGREEELLSDPPTDWDWTPPGMR